jgi:hypothetical protein
VNNATDAKDGNITVTCTPTVNSTLSCQERPGTEPVDFVARSTGTGRLKTPWFEVSPDNTACSPAGSVKIVFSTAGQKCDEVRAVQLQRETQSATSNETGADCTDTVDDDGDGFVNDGCPTVGVAPESGDQCAQFNSANDDPADDGVVNDGCPGVGTFSTVGLTNPQCFACTDANCNTVTGKLTDVITTTGGGANCKGTFTDQQKIDAAASLAPYVLCNATLNAINSTFAVTENVIRAGYTHNVTLVEGMNEILEVATDLARNVATFIKRVFLDTQNPMIFNNPAPFITNNPNLIVSGNVSDPDPSSGIANLTINGQLATLIPTG